MWSESFAPRKQFLRIKEKFLWYTVKDKISLNWRKFCWFKKKFFNVNKSISLDQRIFFLINKTFFNSKKFSSFTVYQRNLSLISKKLFSQCKRFSSNRGHRFKKRGFEKNAFSFKYSLYICEYSSFCLLT